MTEETKRSSFAVALAPEFDENNEWTGQVTTYIEEKIEDDLNEEQLAQLRSVCGLLASCLGLMEEDPDFLEYIKCYFTENCDRFIGEFLGEIDDSPNFTKEGNVITLDFNTKTHGSA